MFKSYLYSKLLSITPIPYKWFNAKYSYCISKLAKVGKRTTKYYISLYEYPSIKSLFNIINVTCIFIILFFILLLINYTLALYLIPLYLSCRIVSKYYYWYGLNDLLGYLHMLLWAWYKVWEIDLLLITTEEDMDYFKDEYEYELWYECEESDIYLISMRLDAYSCIKFFIDYSNCFYYHYIQYYNSIDECPDVLWYLKEMDRACVYIHDVLTLFYDVPFLSISDIERYYFMRFLDCMLLLVIIIIVAILIILTIKLLLFWFNVLFILISILQRSGAPILLAVYG